MADDRLPNIDKLNEANWPIWKMQICAYLQARELWASCTGDEAEPVEPATGADAAYAQRLARYQVKVARVTSILLETVSTGQIHVIAQQHLNSPKEMWDELVKHCI